MALSGIVIGGSAGTGGGTVAVPDVVGELQADAEAHVRLFGLTPKARLVLADGTAGTVFNQQPPAQTIRGRGSVVTLFVVAAPDVPVDLGQRLDDLQVAVDAVDGKVDAVDAEVAAVAATLTAVDAKVDSALTKIDALDGKVDGAVATVDAVATKVDGVATKVDGVATAVAAAETEAKAAQQHQEILDKLDAGMPAGAAKPPGGSARSNKA